MDFKSIEKIIAHPDNISLLKRIANDVQYQGGDPSFCMQLFPMSPLDGIEIISDRNMPKTHKVKTGRIIWPTDGNWSFCEFEFKDIGWAIGLDIAKYEYIDEPLFIVINKKGKVNHGGFVTTGFTRDDWAPRYSKIF